MSFEEKMRESSETRRSKIVLALDVEEPDRHLLMKRSTDVLRQVSEYICAVKINRQLVLSLGLRDGVNRIVELAHELALPAIMDAKLNDVGHTNEFMMRTYAEVGFDGVIVSPVVGWEGGLDKVFQLAHAQRRGVILLVYMSNPGAETFHSLKTATTAGELRPLFELFAETARQWKADGVIVGATRPEIIKRVRELIGPRMAIFSPGVGAQGGDPRLALEAGSNYLIIGRSIYAELDPARAAKRYRDLTT